MDVGNKGALYLHRMLFKFYTHLSYGQEMDDLLH